MAEKNRMKRRRTLLVAGVLVCLSIPPTLNWMFARATAGATDPGPLERLSWTRDLGNHPASTDTPGVVSVSRAGSTFVLPQVLSVEDAVEWGDGWVLLDRRFGKIHFLNPTLGSVQSIGREGQGPGELQEPVGLAREDSVLWVLNRRGLELDRYSLDPGSGTARFHSRRRLEGGGCLAGLAKRLESISGHGLAVLRVCPSILPGPGTAFLELVEEEGTLSPFLSLPLGTPGSGRIHLLRQPVFTAAGAVLFMGTWDAPCMAVLDGYGKLRDRRCLPEYDRARTPMDRRAGLEGRLKWVSDLGLLPVEVPAYLPWYDQAFATSQGLVVRRIRTEKERDLVVFRPDGEIRITEQWFPENTFVGEKSLLVAEDLPQGTSISIYPSPWKPDATNRTNR